MRNSTKIILGILSFLTISWVITTRWVVPRLVRSQIETTIRENCANCEFETSSIYIPLLSTSVEFEGFRFKVGDARALLVDIRAERVIGTFSLGALLKRVVHLEKLYFYRAHVRISEGDGNLPLIVNPRGDVEKITKDPQSTSTPSPWSVLASSTRLFESQFKYTRISKGKEASMEIRGIDAQMDAIGSDEKFRTQATSAEFTGTLGTTGKFVLKVKAVPLSDTLQVDIDLKLKDHDLADLNVYFDASEGTQFTGYLKDAHSRIFIRGAALQGWLTGDYSNLDIQFRTTKNRGAVETFFSNLVSGLSINPSDLGEPPEDQARSVRIQRKDNEAFFKFLFRGLKDVAMAVASS